MKVYSVGKSVGTKTILMDKTVLTESVIGQNYEIQMKTNGVPDPGTATKILSKVLKEKFNAKLLYFEVDDNILTIQIEGSPFSWNLLLIFLPEVLIGIGVIVLFIMVYFITSEIPSWQYSIIALALILISIAPQAVSKIAMIKEKAR